MPIPHKYINTPDDAYEAETSYYLHFQLVSALISLDHIYNCKYSDSDLFESKAQYYHYYTDHLLYSLGQIAERFRESNNPNSTNDYFVRRSANRINYGFDKNNYPILSNKAFRNTIEHIDEHNIEVIKSMMLLVVSIRLMRILLKKGKILCEIKGIIILTHWIYY